MSNIAGAEEGAQSTRLASKIVPGLLKSHQGHGNDEDHCVEHRKAPKAFSNADIALLQEAREPPADVAAKVIFDPGPWRTGTSRG
jgi:hypothetical protein